VFADNELTVPARAECYENVTDELMAKYLTQEQAKNLVKVDVSLCCKLTDAFLSLMLHFPHLTYLCLGGVLGLTDKAAQLIATLTSLKHLDLYRCVNLTDNAIREITKTSHREPPLLRLNYFSVAHCYELTNEAFEFIHEQEDLIELNVRYTKVNDEGIRKYFTGLKNLKKLILYYCEGITKESLKYLSTMESLQEINARYTKVKAGTGTIFPLNNSSKTQVIAGDK